MPQKKTPTFSLSGTHATDLQSSYRLATIITTVIELLVKRALYRTRAEIRRMRSGGVSPETSMTHPFPATRLPQEIVEIIIAFLTYNTQSPRMCPDLLLLLFLTSTTTFPLTSTPGAQIPSGPIASGACTGLACIPWSRCSGSATTAKLGSPKGRSTTVSYTNFPHQPTSRNLGLTVWIYPASCQELNGIKCGTFGWCCVRRFRSSLGALGGKVETGRSCGKGRRMLR